MIPFAVLVVEDEALIRLTTVDAFRDAGLTVYEAGNAAEALTLLETCDDIGLIFTDIDMPGDLNGIALSACVRDRWPPIVIIITSGIKRPSPDVLPAGSTFVPKPYVAEDVARDVRAILAA